MGLINYIKDIYSRNKYIYCICKAKKMAKKEKRRISHIICNPIIYKLLSQSIFIRKEEYDKCVPIPLIVEKNNKVFVLLDLYFYVDKDCTKDSIYLSNLL